MFNVYDLFFLNMLFARCVHSHSMAFVVGEDICPWSRVQLFEFSQEHWNETMSWREGDEFLDLTLLMWIFVLEDVDDWIPFCLLLLQLLFVAAKGTTFTAEMLLLLLLLSATFMQLYMSIDRSASHYATFSHLRLQRLLSLLNRELTD